MALGVGMASVFRYLPDYFRASVGAVGGVVGALGGVGGFLLPQIGAQFRIRRPIPDLDRFDLRSALAPGGNRPERGYCAMDGGAATRPGRCREGDGSGGGLGAAGSVDRPFKGYRCGG
jgi:hypothetical protein